MNLSRICGPCAFGIAVACWAGAQAADEPLLKLKNILLTALLLLAAAGSLQAADGFFVAVGGENGKRPDGHGIEARFGTIYLSEDGKTWENVKTNIDVWACQVYHFDGERIIGPGGG
jgi:hypothetical protein